MHGSTFRHDKLSPTWVEGGMQNVGVWDLVKEWVVWFSYPLNPKS